jgi:hypothetical protein
MIQERIGRIIGALTLAFILGGVGVVVTQAVANEKIKQLEAKDVVQDKAIEEGLTKIDEKLEKIVDAIQKQSVDAAKFHHEHVR